jgi:hypothetical protein
MTDKITIERQTLERAIAYLEAPPAKLWPAGTLHKIAASLRAALAAQPAEPVAIEELQFLTDVVTAAGLLYHGKTSKALAERISEFAMSKRGRLHAPAPAAVPPGYVLVPLAFVQGFNTLAHNYSLRAEPPDHYSGTEGDAFSHAYQMCVEDLARLRAMIAAAGDET